MKNNFLKGLAAIPPDPIAAITAAQASNANARTVQLIVRLPIETRRTLKHIAAAGDTSVQQLMVEAIADLLLKYNVPSRKQRTPDGSE